MTILLFGAMFILQVIFFFLMHENLKNSMRKEVKNKVNAARDIILEDLHELRSETEVYTSLTNAIQRVVEKEIILKKLEKK